MENDQFIFHSFSFFSGVLVGLLIRWSDIIPIFGGFMLGLTVKRLPEFVNFSEIPTSFSEAVYMFKNMFTSTVTDNERKTKSTIIKKKT